MDVMSIVALEQAFATPGWQGPTLMSVLKGVSAAQAAKPPAPGRKCIWEHVLHAAHYKLVALRRFDPAATIKLPHRGQHWRKLPAPATGEAWKRDRALLAQIHEALVVAVESSPEHAMIKRAPGARWSLGEVVIGVGHHDMYHAGQIALIKRLLKQAAARPAAKPAPKHPPARKRLATARA